MTKKNGENLNMFYNMFYNYFAGLYISMSEICLRGLHKLGIMSNFAADFKINTQKWKSFQP